MLCNDTIRIHHKCEGGIEKICPKINDWQHKACQVMTNYDCEEWIFLFYSTLTRKMDYVLLTTKYHI